MEYEYDAAGNVIEKRYYDPEENSVIITSGYAKVRLAYNEAKQVIREEYYGTGGEPISVSGYHAVEYDRDENGDILEYSAQSPAPGWGGSRGSPMIGLKKEAAPCTLFHGREK